MKTKITLAIVAFLFVGTLVAQTNHAEKRFSTVEKPNHLLFSPLYFFDGTFMLTYERLFPSGAIRITPSIKLQNLSDDSYSQREGWGLDAGYKFFLTNGLRKANFYMGPYTLFKNINVKNAITYHEIDGKVTQYQTDRYNIVGFGVDTGIKFIFGRFTMDISLGGGIRYAYIEGYTYKNSGSEWYDIDYKGIIPRGNFSFGVAF